METRLALKKTSRPYIRHFCRRCLDDRLGARSRRTAACGSRGVDGADGPVEECCGMGSRTMFSSSWFCQEQGQTVSKTGV